MIFVHAKQKPNIIFYLADDQNILDYGCYGNEKVYTPAVDKLASEGKRFRAYTGQAICAPSRTMLYTAQYPLKTGVFMNHIGAKDDIKSIANYLKPLGYDIILAGKSHVSPPSVFDWTYNWGPQEDNSKIRPVLPFDEIESYLSNTDNPFCMFIASDFPHGPYPEFTDANKEELKLFPYHSDSQETFNKMKGYYENIKEDNEQMEKILSFLDASGKTNNTVFFYSADHGKDGKFTVYDRGLNVPLIVRWPSVIKPGTASNTMVSYIDVMPTIIDIIGGKIPKDIDGKSFLPVLKGKEKPIHNYLYGVRTNQNIQSCCIFPSRMIRNERFKYIKNFNSAEVVSNNLGDNKIVNAFLLMGAKQFKEAPFEELYDLENDPFEENNLAKDPQFKTIKKKLAKDLFFWMKEQGDFLTKERYMPLLKPTLHPLDKTSQWHIVPGELENTLKKENYLGTHY